MPFTEISSSQLTQVYVTSLRHAETKAARALHRDAASGGINETRTTRKHSGGVFDMHSRSKRKSEHNRGEPPRPITGECFNNLAPGGKLDSTAERLNKPIPVSVLTVFLGGDSVPLGAIENAHSRGELTLALTGVGALMWD